MRGLETQQANKGEDVTSVGDEIGNAKREKERGIGSRALEAT